MELFDFNKTMARGDKVELIRRADSGNVLQNQIEEKIANLKTELDQQRNFERLLRKKANAIN
jgi:hypothetical protein